jgi:hypothetical protein
MLSRGELLAAVALMPLALLAACAAHRPIDTGSADPLADFNGIFIGDAISSDGHRTTIAFNIQRTGDSFAGDYKCAAGNANCRNQITRGWVSGSVNARSFRVSLQDGSWCRYTLGTFYLREGEGDYSCYIGGELIEQGTFWIKRVRSGS